MSRYRIPGPKCKHSPAGTMGYPPATAPIPEPGTPHASTHVCARQECQDDAREWVRAKTRHDGVFTTFEQNRAAARSGGAS